MPGLSLMWQGPQGGQRLQVDRVYQAIALGCPKEGEGAVETNIGRDIRDRKKMGVFPYMSSR